MKRLLLVLASLVASCNTAGFPSETAPPGEPVALVNQWTGTCGGGTWVEGSLYAGQETGWTYLHLSTPWPASAAPDPGMVDTKGAGIAVFWPNGFTARKIAGGEVAVVNPAGDLVAMTGESYKLRVELPISSAAGSPDSVRVEGFQACGDGQSTIQLPG